MTTTQDLRQVVHHIMPIAIDHLKQQVRIPSIATEGFPRERVLEAAHLTEAQLKAVGFQTRWLDLSPGYPAIYGEIEGPKDAPTVLLYAHYDVQPPGQKEKWNSPPFEPTERDGRLYGRGAADDKSGIIAHLATIQAFESRPPVSVKIVIEGDEEFDGSLIPHIPQHPDLFRADVAVICDHGSIVLGEPTFTTTLRGYAELTVEIRTLADQVHNGVFGGPTPDALVALCRMISTLHDHNGNIAIRGLEPPNQQQETHTLVAIPEEAFRKAANVIPGVDLIGTAPLAAQLWRSYAVNVIGLDAPTTSSAPNALIDVARARITLRVPPGQSVERALELLIQHLESVAPWHARITISETNTGEGFIAKAGPAHVAARQALREAYGKDAQIIGDGAAIPLANVLSRQFPGMEVLIWGAEDLEACIHGANERVDLQELERVVLAQVLLLQGLAQK
jgi:acetylornithine deacetylase/succinyl-diaminopimelate desuccinylase-like protein